MYKETDFRVQGNDFSFKKDTYSISRIHNIRVCKFRLIDNLGQLFFWVFVFSGVVWLATFAMFDDVNVPVEWIMFVSFLSLIGFVFGIFRLSRYGLQVEFRHVDETGLQWVNVAKSNRRKDCELFERQVKLLKEKLRTQ